jgi:hypothetical protein
MLFRILHVLLWLATAVAVGGFLWIAGRNLGYAGAFDYTELAVEEQTARLAGAEPFYVEPSADGTPASMPGLPVATWLMTGGMGADLWLPRLLSLLATLGAAAIVFVIVTSETGKRTLGASSAGLMLMGCGLLAGPPGPARPEAVMLLLVLAGCLVVRKWAGWAGAVLGSVLMVAACFTHQLAVWPAAAVLVWLAIEDRTRMLIFAGGLAVLGAGGYVALSHLLGPWFNFHAWDAAIQSVEFHPARLLAFVGGELLGTLGVLTLTGVLSFALPVRPWRGPTGIWTCVAITAVTAALLATQSGSAWPHAVLPAVAALALVGPISIQKVTQHLSAWPGSNRLGGQGIVLGALALQFLALFSVLPPSLFSPPG